MERWLRIAVCCLVFLCGAAEVHAQEQWQMQAPPWSMLDADALWERAGFSEAQVARAMELHEDYLRAYASSFLRFLHESLPEQSVTFGLKLSEIKPSDMRRYFDDMRIWRREFMRLDDAYFSALDPLLNDEQRLHLHEARARRAVERWGVFPYLPGRVYWRVPEITDPEELFSDLTADQVGAISAAERTRDEALGRLCVAFDRAAERALVAYAEAGIDRIQDVPDFMIDLDAIVDDMHDLLDRCDRSIAQVLSETQRIAFELKRAEALLQTRQMFRDSLLLLLKDTCSAEAASRIPGMDAATAERLRELEAVCHAEMARELSAVAVHDRAMRRDCNLIGSPTGSWRHDDALAITECVGRADDAAARYRREFIDLILAAELVDVEEYTAEQTVLMAVREQRQAAQRANPTRPAWARPDRDRAGGSTDLKGLHAQSLIGIAGVPPIVDRRMFDPLLELLDDDVRATVTASLDELEASEEAWRERAQAELEPLRLLLTWRALWEDEDAGTRDVVAAAHAERDRIVGELLALEESFFEENGRVLRARASRDEWERVRRMRRRAIASGSGLVAGMTQFWWQGAPMVDFELLAYELPLADADRATLLAMVLPYAIDHTSLLDELAAIHLATEDVTGLITGMFREAKRTLSDEEFREWNGQWGERTEVREQSRLAGERRRVSRDIAMGHLATLEQCLDRMSPSGRLILEAGFYRAAWPNTWSDPLYAGDMLRALVQDESVSSSSREEAREALLRFESEYQRIGITYARESIAGQMSWDEEVRMPNNWDAVIRMAVDIRDEWNLLFRRAAVDLR